MAQTYNMSTANNSILPTEIKLALEYMLDSADYIADLAAGQKMIRDITNGITVFGSARTPKNHAFYASARLMGQLLAKAGYTVATGGGGGIMEAANRGAFEVGGESIGLNILLPFEQFPNVYTTRNHNFKYFFTRKQCLVDVSTKAVIFYPGGYGTLDELSDVLTQIQTGKLPLISVILVCSEFWHTWDEYVKETFLKYEMLTEEDTKFYKIVDTPEEAMEILLGHTA